MPFDSTTYTVDPTTLTTPRERLEYLRDFLRRLPAERFNMKQFYSSVDGKSHDPASMGRDDCGTAACIAGWVATLFSAKRVSQLGPIRSGHNPVGVAARRLLGLGSYAAHDLFFPPFGDMPEGLDWGDLEPKHAIAVLDHLLSTGEVDWSVARKVETA